MLQQMLYIQLQLGFIKLSVLLWKTDVFPIGRFSDHFYNIYFELILCRCFEKQNANVLIIILNFRLSVIITCITMNGHIYRFIM
jgi:hypothetical protein